MNQFRHTKIVATLGPASDSPEMIGQLIDAGVNFFRLNFSHGSKDKHLTNIQNIREIAKQKGILTGILADLQGPKIRVGEIIEGGIHLKKGDKLVITTREIIGNQQEVSTTYKNLPMDVKIGDRFLLDDGLLTFEVRSVDKSKGDITCEVIYGGKLKSKKGINLPEVNISAPSLTEQDIENAIFAIENDVDYFALSFVRTEKDLQPLKDLIMKYSKDIPVIAKIERQEALINIDKIIEIADGIMVARGDLGVEVPAERVPLIQKSIIRKCNKKAKPVITATQMLESMIYNPRPTRAEVSDVANAILDGTDAVMLSGETAVGNYPIDSVRKMVDIALELETNAPVLFNRRHGMDQIPENDIEESITSSVCNISKTLHTKAILAWTKNGGAIRLLSKYHPISKIIALCTSQVIARRLQLIWGTLPYTVPETITDENDWIKIASTLISDGHIKIEDLVLIAETENPIHKDKINALQVMDFSKCSL